jgi:hypothetical protein
MKLPVKRHEVVQPLDNSYRLIPLTQGQNAIVDVEDFERLSQFNWTAEWSKEARTFYAFRQVDGKSLRMHTFIMGVLHVDHRNHEGLDNRKQNLRKCSGSQNQANLRKSTRNKSGFKGVSWNTSRKQWVAQLQCRGKHYWLGLFNTKEEAARAYDEAAKIHHGEFAVLNFL